MKDGYDDLSDDELAEAAKGGDREARNALFMRHRELIGKLCRVGKNVAAQHAHGAGPLTAEDVDQQAFLIFCDLLASWEPAKAPFVEYLRKVMPWSALHYVRRSLRYRARRKVVRLRLVEPTEEETRETGETAPPSAEAEQSLLDAEDRAAWDEETEGLGEEWRRIIKMRYEQGLTTGEIAVLRGYSPRSINRELRAATDALRERIQDRWEDCS